MLVSSMYYGYLISIVYTYNITCKPVPISINAGSVFCGGGSRKDPDKYNIIYTILFGVTLP